MIELTQAQVQALGQTGRQPVKLIDPATQTTYVLMRQDEYERLTKDDYDDSPWTEEEMGLLAAEAGEMLDSFGNACSPASPLERAVSQEG